MKSLEKLQFHRRPGERRGPGRVEDGSGAGGRAGGRAGESRSAGCLGGLVLTGDASRGGGGGFAVVLLYTSRCVVPPPPHSHLLL